MKTKTVKAVVEGIETEVEVVVEPRFPWLTKKRAIIGAVVTTVVGAAAVVAYKALQPQSEVDTPPFAIDPPVVEETVTKKSTKSA